MKLGLRDKPPAFPAYHTGCSLANAGNRIAESGAAQRKDQGLSAASWEHAAVTAGAPDRAPQITPFPQLAPPWGHRDPGTESTLQPPGPVPPPWPLSLQNLPKPPSRHPVPSACDALFSQHALVCLPGSGALHTLGDVFLGRSTERGGPSLPLYNVCVALSMSALHTERAKRRALIHSFIHSPDTHLLNI